MPGLASLLSRRTMNPRAAGAAARRRNAPPPRPSIRRPRLEPRPWPVPTPPWGGKNGGYVEGYQGGGRTRNIMNPRAIGAAAQARRRNRPRPILQRASVPSNLPPWPGTNSPVVTPGVVPPPGYTGPFNNPPPGGQTGGYVGGYQIGGEVGAAPEEVAMASEIYARATPEQQDQITGGGGPGMMDEEAAIGEALAMAMGGGGGGPLMNGGGPPMGGGGPPMNGAPPMGGLI